MSDEELLEPTVISVNEETTGPVEINCNVSKNRVVCLVPGRRQTEHYLEDNYC